MNVFLPFQTVSLYSLFAAFRKMVYDGIRSMISFSMYWCLMAVLKCFFFFIVLHLLYLRLYPACFEVEQSCFSCLMVHFDEIDVLAFVWFLFATSVLSFLHLTFPSDVLLIYLSHTYHFLVCCFLFSVFQSHFLAFLFLLFWYMLGLPGEYNVWTHRELPSSRLPVGWFCWNCLRFVVLFFSQSAPEYL